MKHILFLILTLSSFYSFCQKEDRIWYFGPNGAGLDFSDCSPVVKTNGFVNSAAFEGVTSICDATTGRLLFYGTGSQIIDSSFHLMVNGTNVANGNTVSQNLIVRRPGSNTIFYYFSPMVQCVNTGIKFIYAVIDMSLNGGLGAVVSTHDTLYNDFYPVCEKVTAVRHANGSDVWLIAHEYANNTFLVYSITSSGINMTPYLYSVGPVINSYQNTIWTTSHFDAIGELKASPDGSKLALTTFYNGITCLFDFDNSTGVISNPVPLSLGGYGGYGVSFSPDNQKLYISCIDTTDFYASSNSQIVQFDLSSSIPAVIQNSMQVVYFCYWCSFRSLKLGPDGKLYIAKIQNLMNYYVDVINEPNNPASTCDYVYNAIFMDSASTSWGLNNIMETNSFCNETTKNQVYERPSEITLFYNDESGSIVIKGSKPNTLVCLYDITGRIIRQKIISDFNANIDIKNIENGIYIITAGVENRTIKQSKIFKY
jgi:hypothetical protein